MEEQKAISENLNKIDQTETSCFVEKEFNENSENEKNNVKISPCSIDKSCTDAENQKEKPESDLHLHNTKKIETSIFLEKEFNEDCESEKNNVVKISQCSIDKSCTDADNETPESNLYNTKNTETSSFVENEFREDYESERNNVKISQCSIDKSCTDAENQKEKPESDLHLHNTKKIETSIFLEKEFNEDCESEKNNVKISQCSIDKSCTNADNQKEKSESNLHNTKKTETSSFVEKEFNVECETRKDNVVKQISQYSINNENVDANNEKETSESNVQSSIKKNECFENSSNTEDYNKYISYQEDGTAIYTEPNSNLKYIFKKAENKWELIEKTNTEESPYENEHYRWCFETNQWVLKEQTTVQYSVDDGLHTYKDKDGTVFFYDENKKAWFPKIDDEFMAIYQLNYGFDKDGNQKRKLVDDDGFKIPISIKEDIAEKTQIKKIDKEKEISNEALQSKKRKTPEPPKWFDVAQEQNTKVYVSNLPFDITEQEFVELMSKCGLIMKDQTTQKFKVKLYVDSNGMLKGDGLCDYIKVESIDLALKILDGYDVRGKQIKVQRARFEMRGEYNPALKPKKKKKDKEKLAKLKEKLLDWRPDKMRGERSKHERVVIIKNLFDPELFNEKVELILEYQNDLREECSKCGNVRKVIIYDRHSDGVASISMSCPEEADLVVQIMNRRFYGKRRLIAEIWDGKTKYKVEETSKEEQNRISNWDKYLDGDTNKNKNEKSVKSNEESSKISQCNLTEEKKELLQLTQDSQPDNKINVV